MRSTPSFVIATLTFGSVSIAGAADDKTPPATFVHQVLDESGPQFLWGKSAGDLNGDGRVDLLAGGWRGGGLVWYENPKWEKHVIDPARPISTDLEVVDLDRDGKPDVVAITGREGIIWYRNPGWQPRTINSDTVLHDIEVADFDGDGDLDIVGRNQNLSANGTGGATLFLYRQESLEVWSKFSFPIPDGEGLKAADVDADGDLDVIVNGTWLENRGDMSKPWPAHVFAPDWKQDKTFIAAGDINGDGRLDIVLSPSEKKGGRYRISWFEAPRGTKTGTWAEHVVADDVETVHHFVGVADFNLDGRADIATAAMHTGAPPQNVTIFLNVGKGASWKPQVIATTGSHSMRIVDLDGDGAPSLFGANYQAGKVELWRNTTPRPKR